MTYRVVDVTAAGMQAITVWASTQIGSILAVGTPVIALFQTSPETAPVGTEFQFLRWAIEQGGLVVALGVMFWVYRKDAREATERAVERARETEAKLIGLLKESQEQADRGYDLLEKNTIAMQQLTRAIDDAQNERFPPRSNFLKPGKN
jgi:hypothetical protein